MIRFYRFLIPALLTTLMALNSTSSAVELLLESAWSTILEYPTRIDVDPSTHLVYVTSPRTGTIAVISPDGQIESEITTIEYPTAIATDGMGHLFVADQHAVRRLAADGTIEMTIGGNESFFVAPHDVAVSPEGFIFVADNDSIKIFSPNGEYVSGFGGYGHITGKLNIPVALTFSSETGELIVADQNNSRLCLFTENGGFIRAWGSRGNGNYAPGTFLREWGIDRDLFDRTWAFDPILNSVQVFNDMGDCLFQCRLTDIPLRSGTDIAIDEDRLFVVSQSQHSIWVYRFSGDVVPDINITLVLQQIPEGLALHWSSISDSAQYRVYSSWAPDFLQTSTTLLATTSDTFYVDSIGPQYDYQRYYRVTNYFDGLTCNVGLYSGDGEPLDTTGERRTHDQPHTETFDVTCTSCHFSNFAYPRPMPEWWYGEQLCKSCHVETGMAQAVQNHFSAADTMYCNRCHSPHYQPAQYEHYYIREVIMTPNSGYRVVSMNDANDYVHGDPNYDGICEVCHTQTAHHRNSAAGDHSHFAGTSCTGCHKHLDGFLPSGGAGSCNACHEAVPSTGAHRVHHADTASASYGDLRITADFADPATEYNFGCGNCHPTDGSHHMNGNVDIEFYNAAVAPSSLKAKNPATASYTPGPQTFTDDRGYQYTLGTCSDIYCHSSGQPASLRTYTDASWGQTGPYSCSTCHGEPPTYPSQSIGGDGANSHYQFQIVGEYDGGHVLGIHWGHDSVTVASNSATVINCNICHYATTTSDQNTGFDQGDGSCADCHDANTLPPMYNRGTISNTARHVSGVADIAFSPLPFRSRFTRAHEASTHGWTVYPGQYAECSLQNSLYDPQTKTCSSIPCHLVQEENVPLQWGYNEDGQWGCQCHSYWWHGAALDEHAGTDRAKNQDTACRDCHAAASIHSHTTEIR